MSETLMPTHGLRLLQSSRSDALSPVLQRMYISLVNGKQIWLDVPIVYDEPAPRHEAPTSKIKEPASASLKESDHG
ncbi:MAG: hypothetical protein V4858_17000 [Pseudomonadota bacterium]